MLILFLKLLGAPILIALASLIGKSHGHRAAGLISGLPVIGGPVILCVWMQQGPEFAMNSSYALPGGLFALSAHLLVFQRLSKRCNWVVCLLSGWAAFVLVGAMIAYVKLSAPVASVLGLSSICVLDLLLPRVNVKTTLPSLGKIELIGRMLAGLTLVVLITGLARQVGPLLTGLFTVFPVTGSVMPAFTLANAGPDAMVVLLRGYLSGLFGLGACFIVLAPLIPIMSWWSLLPAAAACMLASLAFSTIIQRNRTEPAIPNAVD